MSTPDLYGIPVAPHALGKGIVVGEFVERRAATGAALVKNIAKHAIEQLLRIDLCKQVCETLQFYRRRTVSHRALILIILASAAATTGSTRRTGRAPLIVLRALRVVR